MIGSHTPGDIAYEDLRPKPQSFVDLVLTKQISGDYVEAYKQAGYSTNCENWEANARAAYYKYLPAIRSQLELRIGQGAIAAFEVVYDLMMDVAVNPAVRLKAAQDYLTRSGYDKPIELDVKINKEVLSDDRLQEEIDKLLKLNVVSVQKQDDGTDDEGDDG